MRHALLGLMFLGSLAIASRGLGQEAPDRESITSALPINAEAVARIKQLQPNEAALIGKAQVVGEFNEVAKQYGLERTGPRGRDFTIRMVWAHERQRALFCGANHGVPHRINDVWEFDLAAMAWVLLYAPDNPRDYTGLGKDFGDVEFKDGILITKRGGPAVIAHTWWGLTYDPARRQMLFMDTWVTNQKQAVAQLGGDPEQLDASPPLWAFTPATGKWQALKTEPPYPRPIFGGMLEYIPDLHGSIWHANNWQMHGTWLYDPKGQTWRDLHANQQQADFEQQSPAPEQVGYYDPARKLVIVQRHKATHHYHVQQNRWEKVLDEEKDSTRVPFGHDAYAPMYLDPASGHGLLVEFKTNDLWSYDPAKPAWTKLAPAGDAMPTGNKRLAYFDPALNVFVVIHDTIVWAYRYR
jgi:hypothetical protein